jgi:hypothetical protein
LRIWKSKVCNRFFTMGQGAGSRVGTRRFQAMGQLNSTGSTEFNLYSPTAASSLSVVAEAGAVAEFLALPGVLELDGVSFTSSTGAGALPFHSVVIVAVILAVFVAAVVDLVAADDAVRGGFKVPQVHLDLHHLLAMMRVHFRELVAQLGEHLRVGLALSTTLFCSQNTVQLTTAVCSI